MNLKPTHHRSNRKKRDAWCQETSNNDILSSSVDSDAFKTMFQVTSFDSRLPRDVARGNLANGFHAGYRATSYMFPHRFPHHRDFHGGFSWLIGRLVFSRFLFFWFTFSPLVKRNQGISNVFLVFSISTKSLQEVIGLKSKKTAKLVKLVFFGFGFIWIAFGAFFLIDTELFSSKSCKQQSRVSF